jgi:hypothetical protein
LNIGVNDGSHGARAADTFIDAKIPLMMSYFSGSLDKLSLSRR